MPHSSVQLQFNIIIYDKSEDKNIDHNFPPFELQDDAGPPNLLTSTPVVTRENSI